MKSNVQKSDLLAFSQERWNSSFGRTSQIMSRFARYRRVFYIESPIVGVAKTPVYLLRETRDDVVVVEIHLPDDLSVFEQKEAMIKVIRDFMKDESISDYTIWTDTPKSLPLIRSLSPYAMIYDCVKDYSQTHTELEREILDMADLVLTSCHSLYTAKRNLHSNIHNNPDSLDYRHFFQARHLEEEPIDQQDIPYPRVGFSGTIDYRFDFDLLQNLSTLRPDIHFVILGEVKGLDPESLPKAANIHYLGAKSYSKLPLYMAGWVASFVPYKVNEETQYLNPSFIGESLVAGRPVVATPLKEALTCFEGQNIVTFAEFPLDFERALMTAMTEKESALWLNSVDRAFMGSSWEKCCMRVAALETDIYAVKAQLTFPQAMKSLLTTKLA